MRSKNWVSIMAVALHAFCKGGVKPGAKTFPKEVSLTKEFFKRAGIDDHFEQEEIMGACIEYCEFKGSMKATKKTYGRC